MDNLPSSKLLPHEDRILGQPVQGIIFDMILTVCEHVEYLGQSDVLVGLLTDFVMGVKLPLINNDALDS